MKRLKFISLILAIIMITGCLGALPVFAEDTSTDVPLWTASSVDAKGTTYALNNDNFKAFHTWSNGQSLYGNYVLVSDIVLNEGNASDWKTDRTGVDVWSYGIGNWGYFYGNFDGQGHSISGLCLVGGQANAVFTALFNRIDGKVSNLRLVNSYIETTVSGACESGSFAGRLYGQIENCYSDAILVNQNTTADWQYGIGGIAGRTNSANASVKNCVFAGTIESIGAAGGIVGHTYANNGISNCINLGRVSTIDNKAGGIVGCVNSATSITYCMNLNPKITSVGSSFGGAEFVGYANPANVLSSNLITLKGFRNEKKCGISNTGTDISSEKTLAELVNTTTKVFPTWNYEEGYIPNPTTFALDVFAVNNFVPLWTTSSVDAAGTTYALNNDNFKAFHTWSNGQSLYGNYVLVSDIVLNEGNASDWKTDRTGVDVWSYGIGNWGYFYGNFDGQGHSISGLCLVGGQANAVFTALFNRVDGKVSNLRLVNSYIENTVASGLGESGSIVGRLIGQIENCYSDAILVNKNNTTSADVATGGIAGRINNSAAKVKNCVFAGSIESIGAAGGIVGCVYAANSSISDCVNLGSVSTIHSNAGGIVGGLYLATSLTNCMNLNPEITSVGSNFGGAEFIGYANSANVLSSNLITLKGFRNANKCGISNGDPGISSEKTLAELVNTANKVFATWNYEEGYLPNPTTFALDELKVMNFVNADTLGIETQGKIHSIRISPTAPGLRFITFVDADVVDALKALGADVKMKTHITAAKYLQDDAFEFTYEWLNANKKVLTTEAGDYLYTEDVDGYTAFAGSVSNIKDLTMEYIARGCLEITMNGETVLVYANWNETEATCVSRIAFLATRDTSATQAEGYENLITNEAGEKVYSPYTQAQYNSILLLKADGEALVANPADGLTVETVSSDISYSTRNLDEPLWDSNDISVQGGCIDDKGYSYNFYVVTDDHSRAWIVKTNLATGETVKAVELNGGAQNSHCGGAAYNTRTGEIAVTAYNSKVYIYDSETLALKGEYTLPNGNVYGIAYNPLNNEYYTLMENGTIGCYDVHFTTCTQKVIDYKASEGYHIQGTYTDGVYYYVTECKIENSGAQWPNKGISNNLQVYSVDTGKLITCVNMGIAYETESIGYYDGYFYVTCNNENWTGSKTFKISVSADVQA